MNYIPFVILTGLTGFLCGCKKGSEAENCTALQQVKIAAEKKSFYVGDEIYLSAKVDDLPVTAYFRWTHTNRLNDISNSPEVRIDAAEKADEGWFYMIVSYPGCSVQIDSVYISVKNKPTISPCNPTNNTVAFSTIPDIAPATVSWSFDPSWNRRVLQARGGSGYPNFNIYFNTYWDSIEPEDGEYNLVNMITATGAYPPYTVYISSLYTGVFFEAGAGKVYVSHVNNKLRVIFCNILLSGSTGGSAFKTTATGTLTAP